MRCPYTEMLEYSEVSLETGVCSNQPDKLENDVFKKRHAFDLVPRKTKAGHLIAGFS